MSEALSLPLTFHAAPEVDPTPAKEAPALVEDAPVAHLDADTIRDEALRWLHQGGDDRVGQLPLSVLFGRRLEEALQALDPLPLPVSAAVVVAELRSATRALEEEAWRYRHRLDETWRNDPDPAAAARAALDRIEPRRARRAERVRSVLDSLRTRAARMDEYERLELLTGVAIGLEIDLATSRFG